MRTDLRDRLTDLAGHTPVASPPGDLWVRGVRRRRMMLASRVAVASVLVALVGLGGWTWQTSRPVQPADTHGTPHLPDRFFSPSPWLPAFDGPPGQLVAVGTASRESLWHTQQGIYGITASAGQYGFLDLPDFVSSPQQPPAISPDGRHVAYWLSPRTSGSANGDAVGGVGMYDTVTGHVSLYRSESPHGLAAYALVWADSRRLVFAVGRWSTGGQGGGGSSRGAAQVWMVGNSRPRGLPAPADDLYGDDIVAANGLVTDSNLVVDARRRTITTVRHVPATWPIAVSPDARRVVTLAGPGNPSWLAVFRVKGVARHEVVTAVGPHILKGTRRIYSVVAWVDDHHVAVLTRTAGPTFRQQLDNVDIRSGASHELVAPGWIPAIATDMLSAPTLRAEAPPDPANRRAWAIALAVATVVLLALGIPALRSRRVSRP